MALYYQGNFLRIFNSIPTCLQETAGIGELNQSFNAKSSPPHPKKWPSCKRLVGFVSRLSGRL